MDWSTAARPAIRKSIKARYQSNSIQKSKLDIRRPSVQKGSEPNTPVMRVKTPEEMKGIAKPINKHVSSLINAESKSNQDSAFMS